MRRRLFHFVVVLSMTAANLDSEVQAGTITFGFGSNTFNMEFVTIGNPGNLADTTGAPNPAGAVSHKYGIGKFEISEDMIDKYNANFGTANSLVITKDTRGPNKPATSVSWNEAARFVNWLNTSTGGFAAYKFTTDEVNDNIALWDASDTLDYDASNPYRSKRSTYVLPNYNEWYKAAYYDPRAQEYFDYATGSNTPPTAVSGGTDLNSAVYDQSFDAGPADVTQSGGLSPYGVMALNGNVWELEESSYDLLNNSASATRGVRGGAWNINSSYMSPFVRDPGSSSGVSRNLGFRVAMLYSNGNGSGVPEPGSILVFSFFGLGGVISQLRYRK